MKRGFSFVLAGVMIAQVSTAKTSMAQSPRTAARDDMVPRELALALFDTFGPMFGKVDLITGALAPQLAQRVAIPPGSQIVGSLTTAIMSIAVVRSALPPDSALASVRRVLSQSGWQPGPAAARSGGGFIPAKDSSDRGDTWCATDRTSLALTAARNASNGSTLHYMVLGPSTGNCDPARYERRDPLASTLPTLFDPDDALRLPSDCRNRLSSSGSSSGGNLLKTSLSSSQLMSHYAKQLTDSGWTAANGPGAPITATFVKYGAKPDDRLTRLTLTITVPPENSQCRLIEMEATTRY